MYNLIFGDIAKQPRSTALLSILRVSSACCTKKLFYIISYICCRNYVSLISESDELIDWQLEQDIQEAIDASVEISSRLDS